MAKTQSTKEPKPNGDTFEKGLGNNSGGRPKIKR